LDFLLKVAAALDMEWDMKPLRREPVAMESIYELRLYDQILMTFVLETRGIEGLIAETFTADESQKSLFPFDLALTGEGVVKWLERWHRTR
jgi:hypothetical protein